MDFYLVNGNTEARVNPCPCTVQLKQKYLKNSFINQSALIRSEEKKGLYLIRGASSVV